MRHLRLAGWILLVTLCALPVAAAPEEQPSPGTTVIGDGIIVPGLRVGPLRLTMSVQQIIDAVGTRHKRDEFKDEKIILYEWRAEGIWVSLDLDSKALRVISAFGPNWKYRTDKGVSLMETFAKAESVYGQGYKRWEFGEEKIILVRYPDLGLQFGIVNDPGQRLLHGRIFQIGVFRPGDLPPVRQP